MEIWATCRPCNREFYVPHAELQDLTLARCPVCAGVPARIESRGPAGVFELTVDGQDDTSPATGERVLWLT